MSAFRSLLSRGFWRRIALGLALVFTLAAALPPDVAPAAQRRNQQKHKKKGGQRRGPSFAQQREQMVKQVRAQLDSAQKVLQRAQSQSKMTEKELKEARANLADAQKSADEAESQARKAMEAVRSIEAETLAEQGPESELGLAQAKVDRLRTEMDRHLHRVVKLAEHAYAPSEADVGREIARLTDDERKSLDRDPAYQEAVKKLDEARKELAGVRAELLQDDDDWKAAMEVVRESRMNELKAETEARAATGPSTKARRELQTQQEMVAEARTAIARCEAALRQLGAGKKDKPKPNNKKK